MSAAALMTVESPATPSRGSRARRGTEAGSHGDENPSVRKSHDLILMRMRTGSIGKVSLIQRRAVNVLLSVAQKIDRADPANDGYYTIDLAVLENFLGFKDSGNRKLIVEMIRQMCGLLFEFCDGHTIHMGSVIAEIEVDFKNARMRFSLPIGLRAKLLHPERFHHLKLSILNLFSSHSALALYELVSASFTHPARRTATYSWEQLSTWLTGSTQPHRTYREFSKMLGRSLDQVNAVCTTHRIELMFSRSGRATSDLWFSIHEKAQPPLPLEHHTSAISGRLASAVSAIGIRPCDLEALTIVDDEDYLIAQADLVVRRIKAAPSGSIHSPRAYFARAVAENWAEAPRASASGQKATPSAAPTRRQVGFEEARQAWWGEKTSEQRTRLSGIPPEEMPNVLADLEAAFGEMSATIYDKFKRCGLAHPLTLGAAAGILARREWAEPSEATLTEFARTLSSAA